jgi:hypothetical protein
LTFFWFRAGNANQFKWIWKRGKETKLKCLLKLILSMLKTCLKNITSVPPLSFWTTAFLLYTFCTSHSVIFFFYLKSGRWERKERGVGGRGDMHGHKLGKLTAQISCLPSGKSKYRGIRKAKPPTINIHCCSRQTKQ